MRKQIRLVPPARTHGGRQDAVAARNPKWKQPNALKHGVFSVNPAILGEDPREFDALHCALIDEWQPSGLTEDDAVFSIAHAIWCKIRAQRFLHGKLLANTFDPRHPDFDEARGLLLFSRHLRSEPETAFANYASKRLRPDKIQHLKEKFPRSNYPSTEDWAEAVITEIRTELLPAIIGLDLQPGEEIDDLSDSARRVAIEMQLTLSIIQTREFFEHELDQLERLDARIIRLVKNLVHIKAMKQMLR